VFETAEPTNGNGSKSCSAGSLNAIVAGVNRYLFRNCCPPILLAQIRKLSSAFYDKMLGVTSCLIIDTFYGFFVVLLVIVFLIKTVIPFHS
jgi:hypothetical protein